MPAHGAPRMFRFRLCVDTNWTMLRSRLCGLLCACRNHGEGARLMPSRVLDCAGSVLTRQRRRAGGISVKHRYEHSCRSIDGRRTATGDAFGQSAGSGDTGRRISADYGRAYAEFRIGIGSNYVAGAGRVAGDCDLQQQDSTGTAGWPKPDAARSAGAGCGL
jgi:hypothetical protein